MRDPWDRRIEARDAETQKMIKAAKKRDAALAKASANATVGNAAVARDSQ